MERITVVKIGGNVIDNPAAMKRFLKEFAALEGPKILVHGGGKLATRLAERLELKVQMVDGRRITDEAMLEVVTMVYGGLVNKRIVAGLQALGIDAVGLTGADMNIVLSDKRKVSAVDYGWVGDVKRVNAEAVATLIESGCCPVVAPLTHDGCGHMLNTNADTMAGEMAKAMAAHYDVTLMFCFEKPGVLADENDDSSLIPTITPAVLDDLKRRGVVSGGMIPKLDNAIACVSAGVESVVITQADRIADPYAGTKICL